MRQYRDAHIFMDLYKNLIRPLLFLADPEVVHHGAMAALKVAGPVLAKFAPKPDPRLARTVFGVTFPNPVGLAAGFDKNAVALPAWEALGFGFAEVGTITARAQPGNPKPRIFRVPECAGEVRCRRGFGAGLYGVHLRGTGDREENLPGLGRAVSRCPTGSPVATGKAWRL